MATTRIGFLGLGVMGSPMAINLARQFPLTVWNRSQGKLPPLIQAGARAADSPAAVLAQSDVVFTMLFNDAAYAPVFDSPDFQANLRGKTVINTSSISVDCSTRLANIVAAAGGTFIEMPVSGSKVPAEMGQLVGMVAGDKDAVDAVRPLLKPITKTAIYCGPVGMGLKTKYAINTFLITTTAGLAESMHLARRQGLDLDAFAQVVDASPMASAYSKLKVNKMMAEDWSAQAAIQDCYNLTRLVVDASKTAGARSPFMELCATMYKEAIDAGLEGDDMIALEKLFTKIQTKQAQ